MFDIGFFELVLISIVALLVLGPDRLPGAIRTMGLWIGRLRRSFNNVKNEIEREIGADEIRRQLRNEAIMEKFKDTKSQLTNTVDSVKKDLSLDSEMAAFTGQKQPEPSDKEPASAAPDSSENEAPPSASDSEARPGENNTASPDKS